MPSNKMLANTLPSCVATPYAAPQDRHLISSSCHQCQCQHVRWHCAAHLATLPPPKRDAVAAQRTPAGFYGRREHERGIHGSYCRK